MMMPKVRAWIAFALIASLGPVGPIGCDRNVRLADKDIRDVNVRAVTHFGITLDEQATPEQTAFVLLRAIRDDFFASDEAQRKAALNIQFDVAAADVIAARNPTSLSRDEIIYQVVNHWTPAVSHYVRGFETEWEKAKVRFLRVGPKPARNAKPGVEECQVLMEVEDPSGDLNAQVLLVVGLIQDSGFWRVRQVGFIPDARALPEKATRADNAAEVEASPGG